MSLPVFCDRGGQRLQPSMLSRCAPPKGFRITTHFVSDEDRALKAHRSDRDGDDSTIGASNGDGAAGEFATKASRQNCPHAHWRLIGGGGFFSEPHRSAASLKTKQSAKQTNRLSRRHGCASISGRITPTDDNPCTRHPCRLDELVESGCV